MHNFSTKRAYYIFSSHLISCSSDFKPCSSHFPSCKKSFSPLPLF
nr:MAG TPA: hypothetical protein [Caudoviricetes sp.]